MLARPVTLERRAGFWLFGGGENSSRGGEFFTWGLDTVCPTLPHSLKELYESAHEMLTSRSVWENKQRIFYQMRHDGIRRQKKPFQTAADSHYPEIDMAIRKAKPFWMGQVVAGDRLAVFTSLKQGDLALAQEAAADYFDFVLTQKSLFLRKLRVAIDEMLLRGRGILKITVNPLDDYALVVEAINPLYILMPQMADDFTDADEWVHVKHMTVAAYERLDARYDKSPATMAKIKGSENFENFSTLTQDKRTREGITHTSKPDNIIIWEHWRKTGGGWTINTYSPHAPETPLRKPYGCPYKFAGKPSCPFISLPMEVKDEGWYSTRGLGELLAPVEQYLTKLWNEKADAMTFSNRPLYTGDKEIANASNYRWAPGEYIPGNIRGVQQSPPPFSYDQEIMFARSIGEQMSQAPDFGITQPGIQGDSGKARTATENQRIAALTQAGSNDNAIIFRERLTDIYKHIWGLMLQFHPKDLTYFASGELGTLPEQALHDAYLIAPDGSPDGWNRVARFQKAVSKMQIFAGNPNVNMEVLTRDALAADDARSAQKAFIPTNAKGASESEDEAIEIGALQDGFPMSVKPGEDHAARIKVLVGWLMKQAQAGVPVDPTAQQRIQQHLALHWQYLQKTQPQAAKALAQQIAMMEQGQMPANVSPMPQAGGPAGAPPPPPAPMPQDGAANPMPMMSGNVSQI